MVELTYPWSAHIPGTHESTLGDATAESHTKCYVGKTERETTSDQEAMGKIRRIGGVY